MLLRIAALLLGVLVATAAPALAQDPPPVPGTRIGIRPPGGFEPASEFQGFVNRRGGATIVVSEAPAAAYVPTRNAMQPSEAWTKRGMTLVRLEKLDKLPYEHQLALAQRTQNGVQVDVWTLLLAHNDITGTVIVNVAQTKSPAMTPEQVRAMLSGIRLAAVVPDPLAGLPFAIDPGQRFPYRRAIADRQLLLKESPPPPVGAADDLTVIVGMTGQVPVKAEERETYARRQIFAHKAARIEMLEPPVATTIGGMPALEMLGTGRTNAGEQRRLFVVVAFGPKNSYTLLVMGPERRLQAAIPELRTLARSLKPK